MVGDDAGVPTSTPIFAPVGIALFVVRVRVLVPVVTFWVFMYVLVEPESTTNGVALSVPASEKQEMLLKVWGTIAVAIKPCSLPPTYLMPW